MASVVIMKHKEDLIILTLKKIIISKLQHSFNIGLKVRVS